MSSETKQKKNQENFGQKRLLNLRYLGLIGWILVLVGLILTPLIVGLPILTFGWILLVFNFFYSRYVMLVPRHLRQAAAGKLAEEYLPYKPAAKSLVSILKEIIKVSCLVFIGGMIIVIFIYLR